jgi:nitrogen-specific signal transduction histidine kinase/HD-like signal output (HDOD) protein
MTVVCSQISAREMTQLLSSPHVAAQLLGACQAAVFSPQDLQKIILQDSVFCVKVLNAAVSSCSDRLDPGAPLSAALAALGLPAIKSLAIQSAKRLVDTSFTAGQVQFLRELWFYSQVGSIAAHCLAEAISYPDPEEAQLTGLFLNIGMLTLFSQNPEQYLHDIGSPFSSKEVRGQEQVSFATDHLQVADALISGWQLESFLADAVSFSHLDIARCQDASPLIRIARLSREICKSPFVLSDNIRLAGEKLFGFTRSETEDLFVRAGKSYRRLSPLNGDEDEGLKELGRMQNRLTSLVFSLADLEGMNTQLFAAGGVEKFVETARHLYLQNSPAQEAVFFTATPENSRLTGMPSAAQARLVGGLTTSLTSGNLLAAALQSDKMRHSFDFDSFSLSLFDRQLIRLCKGRGMLCLPLRQGGQLLGGIALGLDNKSEVETFTAPRIQMLTAAVVRALAALLAVPSAPSGAASAGADVNLIPKLIHEVSNPLTIINNYMSAVGTLLAGTEHEEIFPAIENEIKRIGEILRYYSQLKDAPQLPAPAVDLNELLLAVVESLKPTFFSPKMIEVFTDFDHSLPPVKTRSLVIKQILVNLLKNAAEALDKNGRISLTTRGYSTSDREHFVDIRVQDDGPGIDKEIKDRLFSPVPSTKGDGHAGLGLNIVKGMVDDIGAKISCHSSATFGTSFNLVIPTLDE